MSNKNYSNKFLEKKRIYFALKVFIIVTALYSGIMMLIDVRLGLLCLVCGIIFSILSLCGSIILMKIKIRK